MTDQTPPPLPRVDAITLHPGVKLVLTPGRALPSQSVAVITQRVAEWAGVPQSDVLMLPGDMTLATMTERPGRVDELLGALAGAAQTFRDYERMHRAKGNPAAHAKADANAAKATALEALLPVVDAPKAATQATEAYAVGTATAEQVRAFLQATPGGSDVPPALLEQFVGFMVAQLRRRALGGFVKPGRPYVVGEEGPETVVPLRQPHLTVDEQREAMGLPPTPEDA